jgi:hypothetical protein
MDCDPRDDHDSRDDECFGPNSQRRGDSDNDRDWDDWRQLEIASRDRDDNVRDWDAGRATIRDSRTPKHTARIFGKRRGGPTVIAVPTRVMSSPVTSSCREDASVRSSTIEIASTRCVAQHRERSRPSARFEWSPAVICVTTTIVLLSHVRATFVTCASRAWSRPSACGSLAIMRWPTSDPPNTP